MIIKVKVRPGSDREELVVVGPREYLVYLKENAKDGKANSKLVKTLAKEFGVGFRGVRIKNFKSRKKIVEIIL